MHVSCQLATGYVFCSYCSMRVKPPQIVHVIIQFNVANCASSLEYADRKTMKRHINEMWLCTKARCVRLTVRVYSEFSGRNQTPHNRNERSVNVLNTPMIYTNVRSRLRTAADQQQVFRWITTSVEIDVVYSYITLVTHTVSWIRR